jgi:hypothetical protein
MVIDVHPFIESLSGCHGFAGEADFAIRAPGRQYAFV